MKIICLMLLISISSGKIRPSDLGKKLTREQKLGQMTMWFYDKLTPELIKAIKNSEVGAIINLSDKSTIDQLQKLSLESSLGLPLLIGRDVLHGFKFIFPIPLAQAASWNPELVKLAAKYLAIEAKREGINWNFAPMIDIGRDPRWGRVAEGYGEDVYLTSVFAKAFVEGLQGNKKKYRMAATAKHYVGYGAAEGGRDYARALVDEIDLWNNYLPPFKAVVESKIASVMTAFNSLNGIPMTMHDHYIQKVLKKKWGFSGVVLSDWEAVPELKAHGIAKDMKEASELALKGGMDMEMVSQGLRNHLPSNKYKKKINDSVDRILALKKKTSLGNKEKLPQSIRGKLAEESLILLKNNGILPLKEKSLVVFGELADSKIDQLGTWVLDADMDQVKTPLEELKKKYSVTYCKSVGDMPWRAKTAVIFVGEKASSSGESRTRAHLQLSTKEKALIRSIKEKGSKIVLVIISGRPLIVTQEVSLVDAVLLSFHPGSWGGVAIKNVLSGKVNPSGKLPMTIPRTEGQIPLYYNRYHTGRPYGKTLGYFAGRYYSSRYIDTVNAPLYPFGFGLSYSKFRYQKMELHADKKGILVRAKIRNEGPYDGKHTLQVYIGQYVGSVVRPRKELKAFKKIFLKNKEERWVEFFLPKKSLSYYKNELSVPIRGTLSIWVGEHSRVGLRKETKIL